jgi:hypothetical protein
MLCKIQVKQTYRKLKERGICLITCIVHALFHSELRFNSAHLLSNIYIVILCCIISNIFRLKSSHHQGDQIQGNLYINVKSRWRGLHMHLSYTRISYSGINYAASAAYRACVALSILIVYLYIGCVVSGLPDDPSVRAEICWR